MYLRVSTLRRFAIYIIDIGLISVLSSLILIGVLKLINFDTARYDSLFDTIYKAYVDYAMGKNNDLLSSEMGINISEFIKLYMAREGIRYIIAFVLVILYLVILPRFVKWQTLGRLITRSKVINSKGDIKMSIPQIIVREIVGTFIFYLLFGGLIGLISAIIAIVTERSLVDRISKTVLVLDTPVPIGNPQGFEYDYFENNQNETYEENKHDDYIDAEVNEDNSNDTENSDDSDDEYRVI